MKFVFKDKLVNDENLVGKLATTKYGDVLINETELSIPISNIHTQVYSFKEDKWYLKTVKIVLDTNPSIGDSNNLDLIVYNSNFFKFTLLDNSGIKNYYRELRNKICFPIINRGRLWYDNLNNEQEGQLKEWYECWLKVTDTYVIPNCPKWINSKLEGQDII